MMARAARWLPILILLLPGVAYVYVSLAWESRHVSPMTGDEPHYLIIADAIRRDNTVDVRKAYDRDARVSRIIGPTDWQNHSRTSPSGTFSVHDVGLPFLVAPAFGRFGVAGVRTLLGAICGLIPFLFFFIARRRGVAFLESVGLAFTASLGLPFLAGSGQVYPDLASGVVLLSLVCYAILATLPPAGGGGGLPGWTFICGGLLLALLPWLHIKNTAAAGVIAATILLAGPGRSLRSRSRNAIYLLPPFLVSVLALASYNFTAFGKIGGALAGQDAIGASLHQAGMIFLGLHFDQLQGIFLQQPFLLLGLPGLAFLWSRARHLFVGLALTYLAIMVPNSWHACWYGCWSMGGRFMWSVAAFWFVPLVFLYRELDRRARSAVMIAGALAIAHQVGLWYRWSERGPVHTYSTMHADVLKRNSFYYFDWRPFLPSFSDFDNYLWAIPNVTAVALASALVAAGVVVIRRGSSSGELGATPVGWRTWVAGSTSAIAVTATTLYATRTPSRIDLIGQFATATTRPVGAGRETFNVTQATIGGESKDAIFARAPSRIVWTLRVPEGALLQTALGVDEKAWTLDGDGVLFRIGISGDAYKDVLAKHVDPRSRAEDRRWLPVEVDLSEFQGQTVEVVFNVNSSVPGKNDLRNDLSYWGTPVIRGWR